MNNCQKYQDMLSSYIDGELPAAEKADLEEHLKSCKSCASLLDIYRTAFNQDKDAIASAPETLAPAVMSRIHKLAADTGDKSPCTYPAVKKRRRLKLITGYCAVAACVALAVFAVPQVLGLRGDNNFNSSVTTQDTVTETNSDSSSESYSEEADSGAENAPLVSASPSDTAPAASPNSDTDETAPGTSDKVTSFLEEPDAADYRAVIEVKGELPEVLKNYSMAEQDDGTFRIDISLETGEELRALGYQIQDTDSNGSEMMLVIYEP